MLFPNQWKNGTITNVPNALAISQALTSIVSGIREVLLQMLKEGKVDIFSVPKKLKQLQKGDINFLD